MREKKISGSVLEGICFGILGTIFVLLIFLLQDYFTSPNLTDINFPDDSPKVTIGLAWLFLGLSISAIFWNVVFRKNTNRFFLKWVLIVISSSITPVLMQMTFLIYRNDYSWKLLDGWWIINLILMLVPFTFLFANRGSLIEKIQSRNALK